jgi:hypothetical protein
LGTSNVAVPSETMPVSMSALPPVVWKYSLAVILISSIFP